MQNKKIYGYTLLHPIGYGGMAEVWYAENKIGNKAAVKILNENLSHNEQIVERFCNEARVTVKLRHPNILQVFDYDEIDGRPCMIMEYLEGSDLNTRLENGERFSNEQIQKWWDQLASALNYTHKQGVIHRDIKPSNIFVTTDDEVKLLDFGIAKVQESITMTRTGMIMGTLMYMSPEQVIDSKHIDHTTDIYSLAVTFIHLLTGHTPYDANTTNDFEIRKNIVEIPMELSEIPADWQNFLRPYLAKKPEDRPALTSYMASTDLRGKAQAVQNNAPKKASAGGAGSAPPTQPTMTIENTKANKPKETLLPQKKKRTRLVIALLITALVLIGGCITAWLLNKKNKINIEETYKGGHAAEFFNTKGLVKSLTEEFMDEDKQCSLFFEFDEEGYLTKGKIEGMFNHNEDWTYDKTKNQLVGKITSIKDEKEVRILPFKIINHDLGDRPGGLVYENLFHYGNDQAFIEDHISYAKKYPIPWDSGWVITKGSLDDYIYEMHSDDYGITPMGYEYHDYEYYAFQYDEKGNLTQVIYKRDSDDKEYGKISTYIYDANNRIIEWRETDRSDKSRSWKISYNSHGNVDKIAKNWEGDERIETFSYQYDSHDNWISRTIKTTGEKDEITTRKIEYYE